MLLIDGVLIAGINRKTSDSDFVKLPKESLIA
ncbi:uncharacterized protein METZ01_LOCUS184919 [marine metagenome]|uniref:Uncharacterized protein n=1 Tax=marine metagenome TaxID=408172 RepID=A0A382D169_9ZZZZ